MSSYIVKSTNIAVTLERIRELVSGSGGSVKEYRRDLVPSLCNTDNSRIQHFYYCDDREGITVRVFDARFASGNPDRRFRDSPIMLRAEKLGNEGAPVKRGLLQIWDSYQEPPRGVNTNNVESAENYFGSLNGASVQIKEERSQQAERKEEPVLARYQTLWERTCIHSGFFSRLEDTIAEHKQIILEGPPGSGKTWVAREFAKWWTSPQAGAAAGSEWQIIQLHESYGYEDFFQGIRPVLLDNTGGEIASDDTTTSVDKLVYRYADGVFRTLCKTAAQNPEARFVLIIDEINRGKTSRVFGELLYLLEYRDEKMTLASGEQFQLPANVYLIGTMNTADRSIALVDYALRRRFRFVPLRPYVDTAAPVLDTWLERRQVMNRDQIVRLYCALNRKISEDLDEHQVVGHSYFMLKSLDSIDPKTFGRDDLEQVWEQSLLPLLGEYRPGISSADIKKEYGLKAIEADLAGV